MAKGITVLDHRNLRDDPELFIIYDHPSPAYFRILAEDLKTLGLLPEEYTK